MTKHTQLYKDVSVVLRRGNWVERHSKQKDCPLGLMITLLAIILAVVFMSSCAHATISDEQAVHCILGEARLDYMYFGYDALLANASALRNRGTIHKAFGCKARFEKEMSYIKLKGIDKEALRAWHESKHSNITLGATLWASKKCDKEWLVYLKKHAIKTYEVGNHVYFKEK